MASGGRGLVVLLVRSDNRGIGSRPFAHPTPTAARPHPTPRLVRPWIKLFARLDVTPPIIRTPPELLPFAMVGGAYDTAKARRILGYRPTMTCVEAMADTYRGYFGSGG